MSKRDGGPVYGDDDMTRSSGWDALLDDLFGLNVRAVRSVIASVGWPQKVFAAARSPDWQERYTPSIRLVFSLIAVTVFLRFLWADDGSALFVLTRETLAAMEVEFPGRTLDAATSDYLSLLLVTYPFTYFGCHALASLTLRIWGKDATLPVRIRLYFAALLPALLFGVLMTAIYAVITAAQLDAVVSYTFALLLGVYILTVYRGLGRDVAPGARAWRSGLAGSVMILTDMVVTLVSSLWAVTWMFANPA